MTAQAPPRTQAPASHTSSAMPEWLKTTGAIVLAIGFGAGVVFGLGYALLAPGNVKVTQGRLIEIRNALHAYTVDHGFPSQAEGLQVLVSPPNGGAPYLDRLPVDAWGNAFWYFNPARLGSAPFQVVSAGPDGRILTDDDVFVSSKLSKKRK